MIGRDDVFAGNDFSGNSRKGVGEFFVRAKPLQKDEDKNIDQDEHIVNHRRRLASYIVVTNREKHQSQSPSAAASAKAISPAANSRFTSSEVPKALAF